MSICDEFKSNCLVRACCSEMCSEVGTLIDSYLNYHMDKAWIFHELITNEKCPVCGKDKFWFTDNISYQYKDIKLACDFCLATYRLNTYKDGEDKIAPDKLIQAYQGTMNGQVDNLWSIKQMKEYFKYKHIKPRK